MKKLVVLLVVVFGGFLGTDECRGQCVVIDTQDCSDGSAPPEPSCGEIGCTPSILNPGFYFCPSNSEGCDVADDTYDGYYSGPSGANSWSLGDEVVCVRCGDCKGCSEFTTTCKNDADNWAPDEIVYDLVGIGVCN
ncbi:MAG: hypothetical protein AB8B50_15810 [Pirellulaceae bacterium]